MRRNLKKKRNKEKGREKYRRQDREENENERNMCIKRIGKTERYRKTRHCIDPNGRQRMEIETGEQTWREI